MILPIKSGRITGHFDDPSKSDPTRIHGALDVVDPEPDGGDIVAPISGDAMGWIAHRPASTMFWPELPYCHGRRCSFANYFYDMFGGVIILTGWDGHTHIITHSYGRQLTHPASIFFNWAWVEEHKDARWPIFGLYSAVVPVEKGEIIGRVGSAGFSTGKHVHWEVHRTTVWQPHVERIDPEQHLEAE